MPVVNLYSIPCASFDVKGIYQRKAVPVLTDSLYRSREGKNPNTKNKIHPVLIWIVTCHNIFPYFEVYFPWIFVCRWDSVLLVFYFPLYYEVCGYLWSTQDLTLITSANISWNIVCTQPGWHGQLLCPSKNSTAWFISPTTRSKEVHFLPNDFCKFLILLPYHLGPNTSSFFLEETYSPEMSLELEFLWLRDIVPGTHWVSTAGPSPWNGAGKTSCRWPWQRF